MLWCILRALFAGPPPPCAGVVLTRGAGASCECLLVQDPHGNPFREEGQLARLKKSIGDALANRIELVPKLAQRPLAHSRASTFEVAPRVTFDNNASGRFTVIEVNARDRPALLNRLARVLFESNLVVQSAHITSYGERAADTFYVTDLTGGKVTAQHRLDEIERELLSAASDSRQRQLEGA